MEGISEEILEDPIYKEFLANKAEGYEVLKAKIVDHKHRPYNMCRKELVLLVKNPEGKEELFKINYKKVERNIEKAKREQARKAKDAEL